MAYIDARINVALLSVLTSGQRVKIHKLVKANYRKSSTSVFANVMMLLVATSESHNHDRFVFKNTLKRTKSCAQIKYSTFLAGQVSLFGLEFVENTGFF